MAIGLKPTRERHAPRGVKSIFARFLISYMALALALSLTLIFSGRWLIIRQFELSAKRDLTDKGVFVAGLLRSEQMRRAMLEYSHFEELERLTDAKLIYFGTDLVGRRLPYRLSGRQDSKRLMLYMAHGSHDEAMLRSVLSGNTVSGTTNLELTENKAVYVGTPIFGEDDAVAGAIVVYRTLKTISDETADVMLSVLCALLFSALLALPMAWRIGRAFSRPLVRLNDAALQMAQGQYGLRIPVQRRDEIGQLSGTVNLLSAQIQEVIGNLRDEKAKLELILVSIGEGIVALDLERKIARINEAALSILEITDTSAFTQDASRSDIRRLYDALCAVVRQQEKQRLSWTTPTGRLIEAVLSPAITPDTQKLLGAVALIRDVSEEQRLEQLRREYIGNVSHELRTPLVGIRGMTEPLIDGVMETEEEKQDCYRVIYRETLRLEKLITEMLELSRLQSGRTRIETEKLPPVPILESALRRFEVKASENDVAIERDFSRQDVWVMGNEDKILQIMTILLDNALDFTPPGGTVTAFCREEEHRVALGVTDTGCGIDPVDIPYIWERFYKADRSRMRTKGTGLGLPIAKLAVELMGGEIRVETEKGKGTTFTFTLPQPTRQS